MDDLVKLFNNGNSNDGCDNFDDDDVWQSDEDEDLTPVCSSIDRELEKNLKEIKQKERSDSFQDLFGGSCPSIGSKSSSFSSSSSSAGTSRLKQQAQVKKTTRSSLPPSTSTSTSTATAVPNTVSLPQQKVNPVAAAADAILDYYSRLRIKKDTINIYKDEDQTFEDAFKTRNYGLNFINLTIFNSSTWFSKKSGLDIKSVWTCGVVVKKQASRVSSKGNDYVIWEISDLKMLEKPITLFLFGSSSLTSVLSIPIGSIIDLVVPKVLDDGGKNEVKLAVSNINQISCIGLCKDFGICKSIKKDGKPCTNPVNLLECSFCIHHAAWEYNKLNSRLKGKGNKRKATSQPAAEHDTIISTAMGSYSVSSSVINGLGLKPQSHSGIRMELQGSLNEMKRNPIRFGNHESITFKPSDQLPKDLQKVLPKAQPKPKVLLNLDPVRTPHLTEKDRLILKSLESTKTNSEIPQIIAKNTTAGSRNFLQHLRTLKDHEDSKTSHVKLVFDHEKREDGKKTLSMNKDTLRNMQKALNYVKSKGACVIKKCDPNNPTKKVKLNPSPTLEKLRNEASSSIGKKNEGTNKRIELESEEFKKILEAKSLHEDFTEKVKREEYFDILEKKEEIENKLLDTFSIATNAVMCRSCKYVALSQSDYCKEKFHQITIVKTAKRFFKCKCCGQRTMCLERLPSRPCSSCKSTSWETAPVGKEKKGPTLPSEELSIRGNEEKFIGSSSAKLYLNI